MKNKQSNFEKFDCSYLENDCRDFFKIQMWLSLSKRHLHSKFGAIWIRNHEATYAWKLQLCSSCQYTHGVAHILFSWAKQGDCWLEEYIEIVVEW